jgi:hypothetical protein
MEKNYIGNLKGKTILSRYWEALPKYICWGIWLDHNKIIFDNTTNTPRQVTSESFSPPFSLYEAESTMAITTFG